MSVSCVVTCEGDIKKVTVEKGIQKYHPPFAIAGILLTILNIPSNNYILYFAQQFRMTKQYPIIKARIQVLEKASVVRYLDILKTLSTIQKYKLKRTSRYETRKMT